MRSRLAVLVSGSGTNLQALIDAARDPDYPAEIVAVGADRYDAAGLRRADEAGIATFVVSPADSRDRADWDERLAVQLRDCNPDWVVSAGFMRLLGPAVLELFPQRIINTHPALLPAFPGTHAVRDALDYGVKITGCTVHLVDAGVDTGPVIAQEAVPVAVDDDEDSLHARIKAVEHQLLVSVVGQLAGTQPVISGRRVSFS